MSGASRIEWTEATWNPVVGCSKVSDGCRNCYAMTMASRIANAARNRATPRTPLQHAYTRAVKWDGDLALPQWSNRVECVEEQLGVPLRWKKGRMVFVNSMSDVFHPDVPFEFIDRVFAVMALCPQHTFQVLTKRPERMAEYLSDESSGGWRMVPIQEAMVSMRPELLNHEYDSMFENHPWPLPNVWLGTSVEGRAALPRLERLAQCPAAVLMVSFEPLLEDLGDVTPYLQRLIDAQGGDPKRVWGICGGESGRAARPMHPDWPESLLRQHQELGVPFFFKQWGEWSPAQPVREPAVERACALVMAGKPCPTNVLFVGKSWGTGPLRVYGPGGGVTTKDHTGEVMVRRGRKASGCSMPWMSGSHREWPGGANGQMAKGQMAKQDTHRRDACATVRPSASRPKPQATSLKTQDSHAS